jgi:3-hydroxyisobutyrate dehydrogenase
MDNRMTPDAGSTTRAVAVIGLGQIGGGVAANLARRGARLAVCDVSEEACSLFVDRAEIMRSPADIATFADIVFIAVRTESEVLDVISGATGILSARRLPRAVVVISTISVDALAAAYRAVCDCAVGLVDCAVTGGPEAARDGTLVALIGGDAEVVAEVAPVVNDWTSASFHLGPLGSGLKAKLARNLLTYGCWHAAWEAQKLVAAAGLDEQAFIELVEVSEPLFGGTTRLLRKGLGKPLGADTGPVAQEAEMLRAIAHKDLTAALSLGADLEVALDGAELVAKQFDAVVGVTAGA